MYFRDSRSARSRIAALPVLRFLVFTALAALPARADSPFAVAGYEISFSDGWQPLATLVPGDSNLTLAYGYSMMGYCSLTAGLEGDPATSSRLDAFRQAYGGSDSVAKVADSTLNLGGKTFSMVEYQGADSSTADIRFRYYAIAGGSDRFAVALVYDVNAASVLVPDLETALGTLSFAGTPIRAVALRKSPALVHPEHDILGRARARSAHTRLYRLTPR